MIYELKEKKLILKNGRQIKLTPLEHKLLIALSDNSTTTYETILLKMYGLGEYQILKNSLAEVKKRLSNKTKQLKIIVLSNIGYRLETEIYYK